MELESEDIRRLIRWIDTVQDLSGAHLEPEDHLLRERLKAAYSAGTRQVVNMKVSADLKIGDYVFASRWSDCDPGDPWFVGHVSDVKMIDCDSGGPYPGFVVLAEAPLRRWPHAMRITPEQGARIVAEFPRMELLPCDYGAVARIFGLDPAVVGNRAV